VAVPVLALIKAIAPYVTQVAAAAIPAFTSKPEAIKSDPVVSKQIQELQTAATHNAQSIQTLAEKLQQAIQGVEEAAREAKRQAATYKMMLWASLALSCASMVVSLLVLVR
jgi:predicted nucleic acid-binding protein